MFSNEEFEERLEGTNQTVSEAKEIVGEFEQKSAAQFKATSNFDQIQKLFYTDVFGNVYYPTEYSGSWIVGEDLHVGLTDVSGEIIKKYSSNIPFPENIKFEKMAKSLIDLEMEQQEYLSFFNAYNIETASSYVDVESNKCVFEIINGSIENAYEIIKNTLSSFDSKYSFSMDSIIIKQGGLYIPETNIIGGMKATSSTSSFSVGVCGTIKLSSGTYEGFCTCGHLQTISDNISINGSEFGKLCLLMYTENEKGDYACVNMTSKTDTLTNKIYGSTSSVTRNITGTADDAAKNTIVMKYGQKSGYATAKVFATNATQKQELPDKTTVTIKGLTQCTIQDGTSNIGDSGGPYYLKNGDGNNYKFIGVHSTHVDTTVTFTPYTRFKSYFTPKTSV